MGLDSDAADDAHLEAWQSKIEYGEGVTPEEIAQNWARSKEPDSPWASEENAWTENQKTARNRKNGLYGLAFLLIAFGLLGGLISLWLRIWFEYSEELEVALVATFVGAVGLGVIAAVAASDG